MAGSTSTQLVAIASRPTQEPSPADRKKTSPVQQPTQQRAAGSRHPVKQKVTHAHLRRVIVDIVAVCETSGTCERRLASNHCRRQSGWPSDA
jgi:hypothetical protein